MAINKDPTFTLLILGDGTERVYRYKIARRAGLLALLTASATLSALLFTAAQYLAISMELRAGYALKGENTALRTQLRAAQDELARIDQSLTQMDTFVKKVRSMTGLRDPQRLLALDSGSQRNVKAQGKVLYAQDERIGSEDEQLDSSLAVRLLQSEAEQQSQRAHNSSQDLQQLAEQLEQTLPLALLVPSIPPTPSPLIIAQFGPRIDPFTGEEVVHKGLDFAAEAGSPVYAAANGTVIFAGQRSQGYGNTLVLDHGFGLQTHYAHLAEFQVKNGQKVERGTVIAKVGDSGRVVSPHLHYEVRLHGVPQDPTLFMLQAP